MRRWVGEFASGDERYAIEREAGSLFFRHGDLPRVALIPLSAEKLRIASNPVHILLRTHWFSGPTIEIKEHPNRRAVKTRRVSDD